MRAAAAQRAARPDQPAAPRPRRERAAIPQKVPFAARVAFALALARCIMDVVDAAGHARGVRAPAQVDAALDALERLPRRVLADRSHRAPARRVLARLARIEQGEALDDDDSGDDEGAAAPAGRRRLSDEQLQAARIESLVAGGPGGVSRAAKRLSSAPLADPRSPEVVAALRAKHPAAELPPAPPPPAEDATPALQVAAEHLTAVLKDWGKKAGTAGGMSGLTPDHVVAAALAADAAFAAILKLVNLILSGELPRHGSLLDSALVGTEKPGGGVRPIAIGEVWYRLAGACALKALPKVGASLAPLQVGAGVSGGIDAAAHAIQAALAEDPEMMVLSTDLENAYNTVSRQAVFDAVEAEVPELLPMVRWAYAAATNLHIVGAAEGTPPVKSLVGVKQGDTLSTLLFCLPLQVKLRIVQLAAPGALVVAIADDVTFVGRAGPLRAAFISLETGCGEIGLRLQRGKCAISNVGNAATAAGAAALAAELGIQHKPRGLVVGGTPFGDPAFVAATVAARGEGVVADVTKLRSLPVCAQTQWTLLRMSLAQRMAHLQRTVPWVVLAASVRRVEQVLLAATAALFQLGSGEEGAAGLPAAPPRLLEQLTLPIRHGGFGLHTTSAVESDAALLAGAAKAQLAMADAPAAFRPLDGAARPPLAAAWERVWDGVGDVGNWGDAARALPPEFVKTQLSHVQGVVRRAVGDRAGAAFLASCDLATPAGRKDAARVRSAASGPGSAWLAATRSSADTTLSNAEFVSGGHHRLGLGPRLDVPLPTCGCGAGDPSAPDHGMSCNLAAGLRTLRHNFTASAWRRSITAAGCATSVEPPYTRLAQTGRAAAAAGMTRGDILTFLPDGSVNVLDTVVTHPGNQSYVGRASRVDGHAAELAAADKWREYRAAAGSGGGGGYTFIPLAMESFGRLGREAASFLSALGDIAAEGGRGVSKAAFIRAAHRRISVAIVRGNARVYSCAAQQLVRAGGRSFEPGSDVPVAENVD